MPGGCSHCLPFSPLRTIPRRSHGIFSRSFWGLTLPLSVEESTYYEQAENEVHSSEDEASALARLHGLQTLQNDYPDAEFVAQKVDVTTENNMLHYRVVYTIIADICT